MEINKVMRILGNIDDNYSSLEDVIPNIEEIGFGTECTAYALDEYCIKDYGNPNEALRQKDIWDSCPKNEMIPKIYGVVGKFLIMEKIEGKLIEEYLGDESITVKVVNSLKKFIKEQIAKGIMSYDLHPENVMYTNKGEVKIIDVGFFTSLDEVNEKPQRAMFKLNKALNNWYQLGNYYSKHGEPEYAKIDKEPIFNSEGHLENDGWDSYDSYDSYNSYDSYYDDTYDSYDYTSR